MIKNVDEDNTNQFSRGFTMMQRKYIDRAHEGRNANEENLKQKKFDSALNESHNDGRRKTLHNVYEDEQEIGISKKERRRKIIAKFIFMIYYLFWTLNLVYLSFVYFVFNYFANQQAKTGGNNTGEFQFDQEFQLAVFMACFALIHLVRAIMQIYLICKWCSKKSDPTIIESRINFYSFFSLGLLEMIFGLWGIVLYKEAFGKDGFLKFY